MEYFDIMHMHTVRIINPYKDGCNVIDIYTANIVTPYEDGHDF